MKPTHKTCNRKTFSHIYRINLTKLVLLVIMMLSIDHVQARDDKSCPDGGNREYPWKKCDKGEIDNLYDYLYKQHHVAMNV